MPVIAPGVRSQTQLDDLISFDGTITSGGTAQLVLPQQISRMSLIIMNISATDHLHVGIGPAKATASLTTGTVSAISVDNGGIGYTVAPQVRILGGIVDGDYRRAPSHPAAAHATLSAGAVNTITIDDPGAGYVVAPLIYLENPLPALGGGAFVPSATAGFDLPSGWTLSWTGALMVPTSAVAIFGPTTGNSFVVKVGGLV